MTSQVHAAPRTLAKRKRHWTLPPLGLVSRVLVLAALFGAETLLLTSLVLRNLGGRVVLQWLVVSGSFVVAFGYVKHRAPLRAFSRDLALVPVSGRSLVGHGLALAAFLAISSFSVPETPIMAGVYAAAWYAAGLLSIVMAGFAMVPPAFAWRLIRLTGWISAYALVAGTVAWRILRVPFWVGDRIWNENSWMPVTKLTFRIVERLLHLFTTKVVADPATRTVGTDRFMVTVTGHCSGWEGTALMLVFSVSCLCLFWREFRFPRALLLVPASLALVWFCNALRLTGMILIGNAGAPDVALSGFHSQAGWIAFNAIALGFAVIAPRVPWFTVQKPAAHSVRFWDNPAAAYLMPFLAIVAASMISRAASGAFETFYPIRFVAAAAALWCFRSYYTKLDWKFGWTAIWAGAVVCAIWLGLDRLSGQAPNYQLRAALANLPAGASLAWLIFRIAAACITVPIAEELAFRGFLIRRLLSADFETLATRQFTPVAVVAASVAFGVLHGGHWIAGTVAGLLYAAVYLRRGRIGDAVMAHVTTNTLLAVWVLSTGNSSLW